MLLSYCPPITKYQKTCTLDILMHLPHSVFSVKQLDLFLWLLCVNNVNYAPGVDAMKDLNKALQRVCGIETVGYNGKLGHRYYVNNLAQILAQVKYFVLSVLFRFPHFLIFRKCRTRKFVHTCMFTLRIPEIPWARLNKPQSGFMNCHLEIRHQ